MISVDEAKKIIKENVEVLPSIDLSLDKAVDYVLAEDVFSPIDFPPFNQSSVDGYAISFKDVHEKLSINGEIAAGDNKTASLLPKHAMRIFTGAAVPANADTVVMQEKTLIQNHELIIIDEQLQQGVNFRAKGKDIKQGTSALQKDEYLSAGAIGFLTGLGITEVSVYQKPSISIIITGNELQQPGKKLQYGQVYESNSFTLKAALHQLHFDDVNVLYVDDNLERLISTLHTALHHSDIILICGGVSAGDYDFVLQAAKNCDVKQLFHKVKQRPGKPLYVGKKNNKIVFGLPGNPSSVLTCFYEYVTLALEIMTNKKCLIKKIQLPLSMSYKKLTGLTYFLKGLCKDDMVISLDAQESYRLSSFAKANCLIKLDEDRIQYKEREMVEVHVLPK